ncbi:hypothetical protein OS493_014112 [Desmophyllum pertusum]|uniref:ShKT domain-containing protein n=1 Tax=Desmophyllum pertusum TaxID=174260 RepID=A0A9X0CXL2_9CNID|nr:hypothetical protein OS493_014112 [Desmophyllum pertusum]
MTEHCSVTCNSCQGEDAQCQDQEEKCSFLARKGECLTNAPYMFVKCRKSCFMCGGISSTCQDKQDNCAYLAYSGHCRSNQSHMLKVCEKSCTRCEGCLDRNKFCPEWAAKGENGIGMCEKNSPHYPYMRFYCQKSCKICSDIMSEE